jgi:hypothetical protein
VIIEKHWSTAELQRRHDELLTDARELLVRTLVAPVSKLMVCATLASIAAQELEDSVDQLGETTYGTQWGEW